MSKIEVGAGSQRCPAILYHVVMNAHNKNVGAQGLRPLGIMVI
jgi:hypothetical protein